MTKRRTSIGCTLLMATFAAHAGATGAATVPAALAAPEGQRLVATARGIGAQIYRCAASKEDGLHFSWIFQAPEAELRSPEGELSGNHFAGPTWESVDGSKVTGEVVAKVDAPDAGAIPWLLLRAKSSTGGGRFGSVSSIQRLATAGGAAPTGGCDASHAGTQVRVPYSAEYRFYAPPQAAGSTSPVGLWKTFDDKTGKARALVRIYETQGALFGRIERSFGPGAEHRLCVPCKDERHNQPIIGLLVIRNLKQHGTEYDGGDILDPEAGSVYRCRLRLDQNGSRLVVRGYLGIALLGRTQTWERQDQLTLNYAPIQP